MANSPELVANYSSELLRANAALLAKRAALGIAAGPATPQPQPAQPQRTPAPAPAQPQPAAVALADSVRVYPDLAVAILRTDTAATARLYYLARCLDAPGRGMVAVADLRATYAAGAKQVMSWRRMRQILTAGEGVFWTADAPGRIRLHGPAHIALTLGVERLTGRPVALPRGDLLKGMQHFRATLLSVWYAGKQDDNGNAAPFSRGKLAEISGVSESSQRTYGKLANVTDRQHFAIGPAAGTAAAEDAAYAHRGAFVLTDWRGRHGEAKQRYLAWRLPNSHQSPLQRLPKGRQRRINSRLTSCFVGRGNDLDNMRVFWPSDGKRATDGYLAAGRTLEPDTSKRTRLRGAGFWYPLAGAA